MAGEAFSDRRLNEKVTVYLLGDDDAEIATAAMLRGEVPGLVAKAESARFLELPTQLGMSSDRRYVATRLIREIRVSERSPGAR